MIRKLLSGILGDYKQVILVRTDLKLPKGKMAAQVAHASVDCVLKSYRSKVMRWKRIGLKKIVLKVSRVFFDILCKDYFFIAFRYLT